MNKLNQNTSTLEQILDTINSITEVDGDSSYNANDFLYITNEGYICIPCTRRINK